MEGCFVSDFAPTDSLPFYDSEGFVGGKLTLLGWHFVGVVVLGVVEVVGACSGKSAHPIILQTVSNYMSKSTAEDRVNIFRELTYLQFCMMPGLFDDYVRIQYHSKVDALVAAKQYQTMAHIFINYSQTLFEVACTLHSSYTTPAAQHHRLLSPAMQSSELKFLTEILEGNSKQANCEVGKSLLQILALIWAAFPMGMEDLLYSSSVPCGLYLFLATTFSTESHHYFSSADWSSHGQFSKQKFGTVEECEKYYQALGPYFYLLAIEDDIKSSRRLINQGVIDTEMRAKVETCPLSFLGQASNPQMQHFYNKFEKLRQKLQYTMKVIKPQGSNTLHEMDAEPALVNQIGSAKHDQESLEKVYINQLYLKCVSLTEKLMFVLQRYRQLLANHGPEALGELLGGTRDAIREIELMCLLLLEERKDDTLADKLDAYVLLAAVKVFDKGAIEGVTQQIKMLFSLDRTPGIEFAQLLICEMVVLKGSEASQALVKDLMDGILKAYQKIHASNYVEYIKLALISTVYLSQHTSSIKGSNRKLQLQKLSEHVDVIDLINNVDLLDYLIELVWAGKESIYEKNKPQDQLSPFQSIFAIDEAMNIFRNYLTKKIVVVQDSIEHDVSTEKLRRLLRRLIQKRMQLTSPQNYMQYFHNHALDILTGLLLASPALTLGQRCRSTLPGVVASLQQINIVCLYHNVPETISRLFLLLLYVCLASSTEEYIKEAMVCLQLWMAGSEDRSGLDGTKVEELIGTHIDKFGNMSSQLFMSIHGYELVEILMDAYGHDKRIQQMAARWVADTENYAYNWPGSRRDKLALDKRIRLLNYLRARLSPP